MERLDGKALSQEWRESLKTRIEDFKGSSGVQPCLAVVLVGDNPASQVYVANKIKACEFVGIKSVEKKLSASVSQGELIDIVQALNEDGSVQLNQWSQKR